MQKENIDYSNTIIYKIYCKDESIKDIYVGHTTNFIQRKAGHKSACKNEKNDLKIYKIIRENGGWTNWDMIEIAKYNCKDSTEARIKENEHYNQLKATLNSCPPYVDKKNYFCLICNLQCSTPKQYETHIKSIKHNNLNVNQEDNINNEEEHNYSQKELHLKYRCEICNFICGKKGDWNRHILRPKHINLTHSNTSYNKKNAYTCIICNKNYGSRNGLWNHAKKCKSQIYTSDNQNQPTDEDSNCIITTNIVMELIKDNKEMKQIILEQNNTINNLVKILQII